MKIIVYYAVIFASETLLFFYSQQYYYEMGYNKIQISLILLVVGGSSCVGAAVSEKISERIGKRTAQVGAFVIAAAFLMYGFRNLFASVVAFSMTGFFNAALYPLQSHQLNRLIPSEQRATLISVNSMFFSIVMILLFPFVGMLADRYGLTAVLVAVGVLLIVLMQGGK